jgi:hypothetical protein
VQRSDRGKIPDEFIDQTSNKVRRIVEDVGLRKARRVGKL